MRFVTERTPPKRGQILPMGDGVLGDGSGGSGAAGPSRSPCSRKFHIARKRDVMGITICAIAAGAGRSRAGTLRLKENASARRLLLQTYVAASADVSF